VDRAFHAADELTPLPPAAERGPRRLRAGPIALTAPAALGLLVFFAAPVAVFIVYSFLTGAAFSFSADTPFTIQNYVDVLEAPSTRDLVANSVIVGLLVGVVCLLIGIPFAYWVRYHAGRLQQLVLLLVIAALFASYLVRIYAWRTMLGTDGVINTALESLGAIDEPLGFLVFSRFAVVVAIVHILLPFVILILYAGFRPLEPRYFEASEDLGAGAVQRWRRVILPLIAVPAMSAFMLCFVLASADYVTPQFLGGPESSMVGVQIQNYFKAQGDYPLGAALAVGVLVGYLIIQALLLLGMRLMGVRRVEWGT
jgi:spermidine/putrescine transport system permease protein